MKKELPSFSQLSISALSRVFNNTTNSYKLYWFYSILQIIKRENKNVIKFEEITAKMLSSVWYTTNYFKISFGKQDKLRRAVENIQSISNLKEDDKPDIINPVILESLKVNKELQSIIAEFHRYVPYRFLTPFFEGELRGKKDSLKNDIISQLANQSFNKKKNCSLYRFNQANSIEIHPVWFDYLKKHIIIIEGFTLWQLVRFLQKRNPNIPNIGEKLLWLPQKRDLKNARKFWNIVLQEQPIACIFSNKNIDATNFSIDHFIPWSFVSHDLLWNLIPIEKSVNSSKSNNLPYLSYYFKDFADVQYEAFQIVFLKQRKLLEDYSMLFQEEIDNIATLSKSNFSEKLYNNIAPSVQIAANAGFSPDWIYQSN